MSGKQVLAGVDAGGTRTTAAISVDGAIAGRAEGAAGAVRPGRTLVAAAAIADTVRRALSAAGVLRADVLVVGAAGAGREAEASELQQALRAEAIASTVKIVTDSAIALEAAFESGAGIVLSAGTGSIAFARDAAGAYHRVGGYGWQMGDEGSGYAIGRAALGAVSRAHDERGAPTVLRERLQSATRNADYDALVRWTASAGPTEVASLASVVASAATEGDAVATTIVHYAAEELAQLVLSIRKRVGDDAAAVAVTGGLLENEALATALRQRLEKAGITPVERKIDAVVGALRLAGKQ